jgi:glutamate/tyrosine decarboxylase-like PLP-dependent enzyme
VLYRDRALRALATFRLGSWTAGPYVTPTLAGSRPGGVVAAAWAVQQHLGEEGYVRLHVELRRTTARYVDAVRAGGFHVLGDPPMSLFAFAPDDGALDVGAVCQAMLERGWVVMPQPTDPPSLHLLLTPRHAGVVDEFARDLAAAVAAVRAGGAGGAGPATYGADRT